MTAEERAADVCKDATGAVRFVRYACDTLEEFVAEAVAEERGRYRAALLAALAALESVQADEGSQEAGLFQGPMIGRALETIRECLGPEWAMAMHEQRGVNAMKEGDPLPPQINAAYEFVDWMVRAGRPDGHAGSAPWWHGWALREAFAAGVAWQKEQEGSPEFVKGVGDAG